jgi:hypothetical protein
VLQIDNSDTVEISSFSYYENGKCLRRKSFGNAHWAEEIQEAELEIPEGTLIEDFDEGESLEYEKNGSTPFTVIETYGIAFDSLYKLEWELRRIIEQ